jgi:hypothetical protein
MDPYEALGVTPSTPLPEIEAAYRLLLLQHHPDLHQSDGPSAVERAEAMTRRLTLAMAHVRADHGLGTRPADGSRVRQHRPRDYHTDHGHRPGATTSADGRADWSQYATHGSDPVPCPYCGQPFRDLDAFMHHLDSRHHGPTAAQVRAKSKSYRPNRFIDTIGALRFVPGWLMVGVLIAGLSIKESPNVWLITLLFVLIVSWAKTSRRYRHHSHLAP